MNTVTTIRNVRRRVAEARRSGKRIGFVPTMGALHEGHLALIRRCRKENGFAAVSIFVNPTQFAPGEDFQSYPRQKSRDSRLLREAGINCLFYPSAAEMYPDGFSTSIDVRDVTMTLCGERRPGHFRGVATVVAKLFHIVQPDRAYFGQKDFQQTVVIRKVVRDLNMPVDVRVVPTVREPDGLAMSSRNAYLNSDFRQDAAMIFQSLQEAKHKILDGERRSSVIRAAIRRRIGKTRGRLDYAACVDADTLRPLTVLRGRCVIAVAVVFGRARLIDNIVLQI
ncbi:MAG: pantoate--beta-alanine ligase [Candidatus Omnitrophota bacterium]